MGRTGNEAGNSGGKPVSSTGGDSVRLDPTKQNTWQQGRGMDDAGINEGDMTMREEMGQSLGISFFAFSNFTSAAISRL